MILKPSTLNFWSAFSSGKGLELTDLVTLVPPRFNQLTVGWARREAATARACALMWAHAGVCMAV